MGALAVSVGDPAGIGPELLCEAWVQRQSAGLVPFFAVGGASLLAQAAQARGLDIELRLVSCQEDAAECFAEALPVFGGLDDPYTPGEPSLSGAEFARSSLELAVEMALAGDASGVVTCPVSKAELAKAGFAFPGQTEFLAHACGLATEAAVMMLAGPQLRTVPVTIHVPLKDVASLLTTELIVARSRIAAEGLRRDFGLASPRLAIAALNPHAGEKGNFGDEEREIIEPAVAALRAQGIKASGPHPADALFAPHARAGYDAAICMYHDQALIPLKALDFDNGVNITLGLPIVRTSPDHGTAYGIAGQRKADPGATVAAIRMAGEAAARRTAK